MNPDPPPPYPGSGPSAPDYTGQPPKGYPNQGYPPQGYPAQGYPPQGYPQQGYPVNMEQPNPGYPNYAGGAMGPGGPYPGQAPYQGYPGQPGWQGGPHPGPGQPEWQGGPPGPMYGVAPKNTVYVVENRRDDTADTCLTACWTALCCCCIWDILT
ncbi:uncharacterized protein ACB057_010052 [Neosynchiropus ocellatus]